MSKADENFLAALYAIFIKINKNCLESKIWEYKTKTLHVEIFFMVNLQNYNLMYI